MHVYIYFIDPDGAVVRRCPIYSRSASVCFFYDIISMRSYSSRGEQCSLSSITHWYVWLSSSNRVRLHTSQLCLAEIDIR